MHLSVLHCDVDPDPGTVLIYEPDPDPGTVLIYEPDPDSAHKYFSVLPISFNKIRFP